MGTCLAGYREPHQRSHQQIKDASSCATPSLTCARPPGDQWAALSPQVPGRGAPVLSSCLVDSTPVFTASSSLTYRNSWDRQNPGPGTLHLEISVDHVKLLSLWPVGYDSCRASPQGSISPALFKFPPLFLHSPNPSPQQRDPRFPG